MDRLTTSLASYPLRRTSCLGSAKPGGAFKEESAVEFAKELYSVLTPIKGYSQGTVKVNTATVVAEPGLRVSEINIATSGRKVTILLTEGRE
jgi:hypothetical protein